MSAQQVAGITASSPLHVRGQNRILSLLPPAELEQLRDVMEKVSSAQHHSLFASNEPISHAWFPLSAIASLVVYDADGRAVEVGTIGNEGFAGVPLAHGVDRSPTAAFTQVPGDYLRISAPAFAAALARYPEFALAVQRFTQAFLVQVSQSTACNRLHSVDERLARWILLTHDRLGTSPLPLTQEFLAMMLGVRRSSVTIAAAMLQHAQIIRYRRGVIDVLDRAALEDASCECYLVVRREYERLLG
jgi:CRP-like cAMP-binding protein